MDDSSGIIILSLVLLIAMSAFFSCSETAFTSVNKARLKSMANNGASKRAQRAYKLTEKYDQLLSTLLIGNNIVNILAASLSTVLFVNAFRSIGESRATALSTAVITIAVLLFGEISPKTVAKRRPEAIAIAFAPALSIVMKIFTPLNYIMLHWQMMLDKFIKHEGDSGITEEELITYVEEAEIGGEIDEHEGELIRSAIEFYDLTAEDILTPRVDIAAVDINSSAEEISKVFRESGFSRLPVYEESIDNVVGVIHERDFHQNQNEPIGKIMTPPQFTIASVKLPRLLQMFQKNKGHMAIVADEYGGVAGLVTMEDLLEELVGEIWDEHDEVIESFEKQPDGSYLIACSANLDDMLEMFNIDKEYDSVTVSGWVLEEMGHFPQAGDKFTYENMEVTVERVAKRRVLEIRVKPMSSDEKEEIGEADGRGENAKN